MGLSSLYAILKQSGKIRDLLVPRFKAIRVGVSATGRITSRMIAGATHLAETLNEVPAIIFVCGPVAYPPNAANGAVCVVGALPGGPTCSATTRHLTVLFCDLVGSTEIAGQLDPEEWREMVASYQSASAEAISGFGGHVAKFLGDGVMAFLAIPEAHDNDAERATRAGLAILHSIAEVNEQTTHRKLSAMIRIDSGPVVVGVESARKPTFSAISLISLRGYKQ